MSISSATSSSSLIDSDHHSDTINETEYEPSMPIRLDYLLNMKECNFSIQKQHAWNPNDSSANIFVKDLDPLTFHRYPVAQSTDCIRTKIGYTKGIHLFKISWSSNLRGTHAIIGVASDKAQLHCVGYESIVGNSNDSWGWNLSRNTACHDRLATPYPDLSKSNKKFIAPDEFMMCLDMDLGTLSFLANGQYLGEAFRGLKGKKLYPIVSTVWGHCEITIRYLNGLDLNPLPLTNLCRICIRQKIGNERLKEITKLDLPAVIKNYLLNNY